MSRMKLYSKSALTTPLEAMSKSGRFVHSYIITGERGVGKKVSALYIAMLLLCDKHNACGECRQCRRVLSGNHPDFITVDKKGGRIYTVENVREVVADSYVVPNDCDRKVYFFPDCEGWTDASQDALLKITEDPPDHAYFIFSAARKNTFLGTVISRSMTIEIHEADKESCKEALRERGKYTEEQIASAVEKFGGNIGICIDYLEGSDVLEKAADCVMKAVDAIAARDEYTLAVTLNDAASSRDEMRYVLDMLAHTIRDAAVLRSGGKDIIGCTKSGAAKLTGHIPLPRLVAMYDDICDISDRCMRNCNAAAAAAVLAGQLAR